MTNPASPDSPPVPRSSYASEPCHLPSTLSTLLAAAISDARKLSPDFYYPCSDKWHFVGEYDQCFVCLAGGLIARTLNNPSDVSFNPDHFSVEAARKLRTVDAMRQGMWCHAYRLFYEKDANFEVSKLLCRLRTPAKREYQGWVELDIHLNSLELLLPQLREIDELSS